MHISKVSFEIKYKVSIIIKCCAAIKRDPCNNQDQAPTLTVEWKTCHRTMCVLWFHLYLNNMYIHTWTEKEKTSHPGL